VQLSVYLYVSVCLCVRALECHHTEQQLADTSAELWACRGQLSTCQSDLSDQHKRYDDLIAARDETIHQLHNDSQQLQQQVNTAVTT